MASIQPELWIDRAAAAGLKSGDEIVRVLTGELGAEEALANAERTVAALGSPDPVTL